MGNEPDCGRNCDGNIGRRGLFRARLPDIVVRGIGLADLAALFTLAFSTAKKIIKRNQV